MTSISHDLEGQDEIPVGSEMYRKIRPLYIVQLVVLISLVILAPINYMIFKGTVKPSHETHGGENDKKYVKPKSWEFNRKKPKVLGYADEFLFKPSFIRSYHQRSKVLTVLKNEFEKAAKMYEHGHDDHGHGHGHGDGHGHGHDEGHGGHGNHGHGHGKELAKEAHHDTSQVNASIDDNDDDFTL